MTIDEAIKHAREVAVDNRNNLKYAPFTQEECIKCAEEHEQLAEWLEELKELKKKWLESDAYNEGLKDGKADAINECINILNDSIPLVDNMDIIFGFKCAIERLEQIKE